MDWHDRLKGLLASKAWTAAELSRRSGVPKENVYKYVRGEIAAPRGDVLDKLANALDVPTSWLTYGVIDSSQGGAIAGDSVSYIPVVEARQLIMLSRGGAVDGGKFSTQRIAVPGVDAKAFAIKVTDAGMVPKFELGDTVVVDPAAEITPGCYVLARIKSPDAVVIRRFRATHPGDTIRGVLVAENRDYPDITIASEADGWIIARAIKRLHDL